MLPLPFPGLDRVNAYLLASDDGFTLIDCGLHRPGDPERENGWLDLVDALAACGAAPSDVARLLITHSHVDHYGMAGHFLAETGCELWMHHAADDELDIYRDPEGARDRLKEMLADHGIGGGELEDITAFEDWRPFVSAVVPATRSLRGGERVPFRTGGWEVIHTPGHARSHVCLWHRDERLLMSGDHLLASVTPHIDFRRGDDDPLGNFLASLQIVEDLAPELVLPGHGRPFEDGGGRARVVARHHDRRLGAILQVIRHEPRTAGEITQEIFGSTLLHFHKRLALGEVFAHLAYLRRQGEIERVEGDDNAFRYVKVRKRRDDEAEG